MASRSKKGPPADRLSPAEWQVMRIVWRQGRTTARRVLEEDLQTHQRDYRTILTFLGRMATKGWLKVEKEGNTNCYTPTIGQEDALEGEITRFLTDVLGLEPQNLRLLNKVAGRVRPTRSN